MTVSADGGLPFTGSGGRGGGGYGRNVALARLGPGAARREAASPLFVGRQGGDALTPEPCGEDRDHLAGDDAAAPAT